MASVEEMTHEDESSVAELTETVNSLKALVAEAAIKSDNQAIFEERIADLEMAIDDIGWSRFFGFSDKFDFSRDKLDDLIDLSRTYWLKNPIIRRPVELQAYYVWAQGVTIFAEGDLNEIVQDFLEDESNKRTFTSHEAMMQNERRLRVDGNLFFRFFVNQSSGRVQVRRLPTDEIRQIITNPEDSEEVWFYLRSYRVGEEKRVVLYPDYLYIQRLRADTDVYRAGVADVDMPSYENVSIDWNTPVMHRKTGCLSDMAFGVPETYAAIDWARAYKELLEDHKRTVRSLAKWAWKMKNGGGKAQLDAMASSLRSTFAVGQSYAETNPAPTGGSIALLGAENDIRAIDVSKATIDPETFRRTMLMSATAMGMSDNFYGDSSTGNLASAKTLDRPMELMFLDRQRMWEDIFKKALMFVIEAAALAPNNDKVKAGGYKNGRMVLKVGGKEIKPRIVVDFPPILQKDTQSVLQALVSAVTMNGQPIQVLNDGPTLIRMICTGLGMDDVESIVEVFYPKDGSESKAKPIKTFSGPKGPEDVEKEAEDAADAAAQMATSVNNQKKSPSALGFPPAAPQRSADDKRPPAVSSPQREGASVDPLDEAERIARIEFMNALVQLQGEMRGEPHDD